MDSKALHVGISVSIEKLAGLVGADGQVFLLVECADLFCAALDIWKQTKVIISYCEATTRRELILRRLALT